jgi:hypothetical protein
MTARKKAVIIHTYIATKEHTMSKMKELYCEITELYDEQGLAADEIAAITSVPQEIVEEIIADFEEQLDAVYGDY